MEVPTSIHEVSRAHPPIALLSTAADLSAAGTHRLPPSPESPSRARADGRWPTLRCEVPPGAASDAVVADGEVLPTAKVTAPPSHRAGVDDIEAARRPGRIGRPPCSVQSPIDATSGEVLAAQG